MHEFCVKRPTFLAATSNLHVEQNLVDFCILANTRVLFPASFSHHEHQKKEVKCHIKSFAGPSSLVVMHFVRMESVIF